MELEEIKKLWSEQDKSLDNVMAINTQLLKHTSVNSMKSLLKPFTRYNVFEFISNGIFAIILIGFLVDHYNALRFALPALILLGVSIYTLIQNVIVLKQIQTVDYTTPITTIQKKIASLKLYTIRQANLLYVLIPVFYACFAIVAAEGLLRLDIFIFPTEQLIYQLLGSCLIAPIVVWFLKKFPDKGIESALKFVESIEKFEEEG